MQKTFFSQVRKTHRSNTILSLYRRMSYIIPAPEPTYSQYQLKDVSKHDRKNNIYITLSTQTSVDYMFVTFIFPTKKCMDI